MSRVESVASRAARRALIRAGVTIAGPALAIGAGVALIAALTDRLIGPGLSWWMILPASVLVPAAVALVIAWARRGSRLGALAEVDASLRLEDRLGSAMSLADRAGDDPFAQLAVREGERAAEGVRVERAIPVRFGNAWVAWGVMLLLAAAVTLFVEPMHLLRNEALHTASIEQIAQQDRAGAELDDVSKAIEQISTDTDPAMADTPGADEALAELEDLRRELQSGETDADTARSEAAQSLNTLADGMERSAEQTQAADDALREMFSQLPPRDAPSDAADRLSEALRSGDLDNALKSLDELRKQADQLPPQERRQAAEDLRALADDLEKLAEAQRAEPQPSGETSAETPDADQQPADDSGLTPEQRDELRDMGDKEQIEQALRDKGFDEDPARRLAEQLEREHKDEQARKDAAQRTQDMSDAARDAAEDIEKPGPPADLQEQSRSPGEPSEQGRKPGEQKPGDQQQGQGDKPKDSGKTGEAPDSPQMPGAPTPQQSPAQKPSDTGKPKPSDQGKPQPKSGSDQGQSQQQPGQQPQPGQQQDPSKPGQSPGQQEGQGQQQPGKEQGRQPGDKPGEQTGQGESKPTGQPSEQPGGQPGGAAGKPGAVPQAQDGGGAPHETNAGGESGEKQSDEAHGPGGSQGGSGVERLRQQIEDLRRQGDRARQQQERAQDIREHARQLLNGMSDEERQRMLDWANDLAKEHGQDAPGDFTSMERPPIDSDTTPLDIRKQGDGGQIAGEFNDPKSRVGRDDVSNRAPTAAELRQAIKGLDQLVEDRAVPKSRQRVIERYFRKALERAEREQSSNPAPTAEPVQPAPDAGG